MTHELQLELYNKYPKILKNCGGDLRTTGMAFWMQCENGWFNLLDECMNKLQYFCNLCSKNGREVQVVASTIKEKYSTLRFYVDIEGANEIESKIIDDLVSEAERKSERTCEVTGKDGESCVRHGWYKTLCYEEARKQGYTACNKGVEEWWKNKDAKTSNK